MSTPSILYRNILAEAQAGRGSGEILAWGSSAVPNPDNKTFDLTTVNIMADLGADADNKFNGWKLIFTASGGGEYLITDWVAATDLASTFERPRSSDTGSWEIRRTLSADAFDPTAPIRYATNGRPYQSFLDNAPNTGLIIRAYLPNLIDDGGFERADLSQYWTTRANGDGAVTLNSATPMLGARDCLLDMGTTATSVGISQAGEGPLEAGKTYAIRFKAKRITAETTGKLTVDLRYTKSAGASYLPTTFEKIDGADTINNVGGGSELNQWKPVLGTAAAWERILFTVPESVGTGDWELWIENVDSTNRYDAHVDQIVVWEVLTPDTLLISGHNFAGGFSAGSEIYALMCDDNLSSFNIGVEASKLIDLDADVTVAGDSTIRETFTPTTEPYPIFQIIIAAISGKTHEFGELWLGKRWDWPKFISGDWEPSDGEIKDQIVDTEGGIEVIEDKYEKERRSGEILRITSAEKAKWDAFWNHCKRSKPFWYYHDRFTALGQDPEILFMRNASKPRLPVVNTRFNANYSFIEVL